MKKTDNCSIYFDAWEWLQIAEALKERALTLRQSAHSYDLLEGKQSQESNSLRVAASHIDSLLKRIEKENN